MSQKTYTVFWSGGLDSTYLIQKLLRDGAKVEACYIELTNNEQQTKREQAAIAKLLPIFNEDSNFHYRGIAISVGINMGCNAILTQGYCWFASSIVVREGVLALGYVMNDDAISFLEEFRAINTALNGLRQTSVDLEFPLSKTSKSIILGLIDRRLFEHVVWCESGFEQEKPCGDCTSCRRMKTAYGEGFWPTDMFEDGKKLRKYDAPGVSVWELDQSETKEKVQIDG